MVRLTVDNKEIEAEEGENLLQVCLDNGIYVPNLCHIKGLEKPSASCRLCFVEVEGEKGPLPSCTLEVREGMAIRTDSPPVRELQRTALRLLLSAHDVDCAHCPANKRCELQKLAKFLGTGLKPKDLEKCLKEMEVDQGHPYLAYYLNRCVLCGKCVHACRANNERPLLTFARRGIDTVISLYCGDHLSDLPCDKCHACVDVCPVSAIVLKKSP